MSVVAWGLYMMAVVLLLISAYLRGYTSGVRWSRGLWTGTNIKTWEWSDSPPLILMAFSFVMIAFGTFPL